MVSLGNMGGAIGGALGGLGGAVGSVIQSGLNDPMGTIQSGLGGAMIPGVGALPAMAGRQIMGGSNRSGGGAAAGNPYSNMGFAGPVDNKPNLVDQSELTQLDLKGQSFDPYRQQALSDINAQTASGLAGAQTNLAQTGGLGAADRMAMASRFNRDKIMGRQQALGKYAGMESQSAADADRANQMFNAQAMNQNLYANQRARDLANERNLQERNLQRQLQASGQIADATMAQANQKPGGLLGGSVIPGIL